MNERNKPFVVSNISSPNLGVIIVINNVRIKDRFYAIFINYHNIDLHIFCKIKHYKKEFVKIESI